MAFPSVVTRTPSNEGSQVTSHTVTLPASPTTGNLLVAFVGVNQTTIDTWPAGWTEFGTIVGTSELAVAWREVDGTEGASITVTSVGSARSAHAVYEISGMEDPDTQPPESSPGDADVSSFNPNPDSLTPTGGAEDFLWLAAHGSEGSQTTAAPANYTDLTTAHGGGTGGGAHELAVAERNLNAASEDPGVFTVDAARNWQALTVAVHPAGAAFSSTSLFATGDGTIVDVVNESDAATPLSPSVDDDPASPDDNDWVNNAVDVT